MNVSNDNISYENAWKALKEISKPAMLIVALIHLGKLLFELGEKQVFGPMGIGVNEFEALFSINHFESPTPTILAQHSLMQPAKITRVLDRLENIKAIARYPIKGDRRSYSLALTQKGEKLYDRAVTQFKEAGRAMGKDLGSANVNIFSRLVIGTINEIGGYKKNESTSNPG